MGTTEVEEVEPEVLGCAAEPLDVALQDEVLEKDLEEISKLDKPTKLRLASMPKALSYFSWSSSGINHYAYPYNGCSPNLVQVFNYFRRAYPGTSSYGCHNDRYVAGTRTWSSHAWGAAYDINFPNRGATEQGMNYLIANYSALGINTIHDYRTQRMWKPGIGWRSAGIGSVGGTWIHVETTPGSFQDGRSVEERVGGGTPVPPLPPGMPPYDPWHHKYGLYPVAAKSNLNYGTGYTTGTQHLQGQCTYFNHVAIFEAGQVVDEPFVVFTNSSIAALRNIKAFFDPNNTNYGLGIEAYAGFCGPEMWKIIDYLASRPR